MNPDEKYVRNRPWWNPKGSIKNGCEHKMADELEEKHLFRYSVPPFASGVIYQDYRYIGSLLNSYDEMVRGTERPFVIRNTKGLKDAFKLW